MDPRRGAAACGLSLEIPSAAEQCEPVRDIEGGVSPAGRLREGSGERRAPVGVGNARRSWQESSETVAALEGPSSLVPAARLLTAAEGRVRRGVWRQEHEGDLGYASAASRLHID